MGGTLVRRGRRNMRGLTLGLAFCLSAAGSGQMMLPRQTKNFGAVEAQKNASKFLAERGIPQLPRGEAARMYLAALTKLAKAQATASVTGSGTWTPVGPMQVLTSRFGLIAGRVTSIAADPSDTSGNTVYLGTTGGGVWRSTNAAGLPADVTFQSLTDTTSAYSPPSPYSLSIGAITVQPGGTGVVLAGTGDPNDATDSYYGEGILRSTDGGQTWSLIPHADLSGPTEALGFYGDAFAGFAWSTVNPDLVVAAVTDSAVAFVEGAVPVPANNVLGLYYSTDAGATPPPGTKISPAESMVYSGYSVFGRKVYPNCTQSVPKVPPHRHQNSPASRCKTQQHNAIVAAPMLAFKDLWEAGS